MNLREWQQDPLVRAVLEERARQLAHQEADAQDGAGEEVLTFRLGESGYSLPIRSVREVYPLRSYTPLPVMPPFVVGLVNLRGRLLTVLDIRPLLGLPLAPVRSDSFLLRVSADSLEVGLLIDSVEEVHRSDSQPAPALSALAGQGLPWVRGVDQRLNLQLDPVLLLADPRLTIRTAREPHRSES